MPGGRRPRLVILGASTRIAAVARTLGCDIWHVQKPGSDVTRFVEARSLTSRLFSVDYTTPGFETFLDGVLGPLGPDAIVSVTESGLIPAALANERLGLPGTRLVVAETLRDKLLMRRLLDKTAPDLSPAYAAADEVAARQVIAVHGRAILKPRRGSGSRGVRLLTGLPDLDAAGDLDQAIVEEYLPGQEYSAETFSVGGRHRLVAVAEKQTDASFVETAHVVPAPSLSAGRLEAVAAAIGRFLDAVSLTDGPAHTEFKVCGDTVKIIESHNRIAGDGIPELVRLATGVDLKRWSLGWPVGLGAPDDTPAVAGAAAIAFKTAPAGIVTDVGTPEAEDGPVRVEHIAVTVSPGDEVSELASSADRVGSVTTSGSDPSTTLATALRLADRMIVATRPRQEAS